MNPSNRHGFTLIELSLVLVIIGLLIGGVLTGRDLIQAASIRAQISQIEKYQAAVNTFRAKYNALPGDISAAAAAAYGFAERGASSDGCEVDLGCGDGNGIIQAVDGNGSGMYESAYGGSGSGFRGELSLFWSDLGKAGLIEDTFVATVEMDGTLPVSAYVPRAKIGGGNYVAVWSGGFSYDEYHDGGGGHAGSNGVHYYTIVALPYGLGEGLGSAPGLSVFQAAAMDQKTDDGFPQTGRVTALYPGYEDVPFQSRQMLERFHPFRSVYPQCPK
jgi:prepilin-type N-terminal cleavage/methylation domain-containing protein